MDSSDKTNLIHFLVTEYWKLKDEQHSRIEYRDHMTYLTLGAIGAVFSFAIEKPDYAVSLFNEKLRKTRNAFYFFIIFLCTCNFNKGLLKN
jgi:hypothetical protein